MDVFEACSDLCSFESCGDEPLERKEFGRILEAGSRAPSPGNAQCMEFIVVESDEGRQKIAEAAGDSRAEEAPMTVLLLEDKERMRRRTGNARCESSCVAEATAAAQNMRLVAEEMGLKSCWITGFEEDLLRQQFRIPEEKMVAGIVLLARSGRKSRENRDFELNEIAFYEEYNNHFRSQFDKLEWKGTRRSRPAQGRRDDSLMSRIRRILGLA